MALMGLEAIFRKPQTTVAAADARGYPYLLRDRVLPHVNEVWSSDITYVLMRHGFMYLTAVIDWYSRYVLSWRLSNTLEGQFRLEALDEALSMGRPEIFNTDQGSQFTAGLHQPLGGGRDRGEPGRPGRALDNVFVERLWRSVKYENRGGTPVSGEIRCPAAHNAVGLAGESPAVGIDCLSDTVATFPGLILMPLLPCGASGSSAHDLGPANREAGPTRSGR